MTDTARTWIDLSDVDFLEDGKELLEHWIDELKTR